MDTLGTTHIIDVGGIPIAWSELGDGPPLVLLHGVGDSHRTWRLIAPHLAPHFRVLMPDLPGHGLSGRPDAPYTLPWYAETMSAWMGRLGLDSAKIGAHSFGGGIAQWMLLGHRSRIDRLALISPGGLGQDVGLSLRLPAFPLLGSLLSPLLMRHGTRAIMQIACGAHWQFEAEELERLAWMNTAPGSGRAFQRTIVGVMNLSGQHKQTWQRIHEIVSLPPIALFWGERDSILPVGHGHFACERIEHITLSVYPRCGHFPHLEEPQRLANELTAFMLDEGRLACRIAEASSSSTRRRVGSAPRGTSRRGAEESLERRPAAL